MEAAGGVLLDDEDGLLGARPPASRRLRGTLKIAFFLIILETAPGNKSSSFPAGLYANLSTRGHPVNGFPGPPA